MHETSQLLLSNWESTALEMCVFSYRVNKWLRLNATIQIMTHPPLVVADVLCKSNTATTTEKVDIGGVVWKWTQVHPTSLILQTQTMVEISWALPEMIWQSHLHTIWQTPSECHTNKNDACQTPSEEPANSCQCPSKVARPKFNAVWVFMTCYRKALPVGFLHSANSLDYAASSAYPPNSMYTNHNNKINCRYKNLIKTQVKIIQPVQNIL